MILHSHGRAMRSPKSTLAMLAGIAFKVVLLAVFCLDEIFPGPAGGASRPVPPGSHELGPFHTFCEPLT
jgi:hypothetical protein